MTENTIIGFEFEFGWTPLAKVDHRPKSKTVYFENIICPEVQAALAHSFNEELSCVEDCTVRFDQSVSYWKTSFGAEVVTKPMPLNRAIVFLNDFLDWMSNHPQVVTNETCSLHINISYVNSELNKQINYWDLLQNCPQEEILKKYSRLNNKFCRPFSKLKYALRSESHCTSLKTYKQWQRIEQRRFLKIALKAVPLVYGWESYEGNKDKAVTRVFELSTRQLNKKLSEELMHTLTNSKKSLAIVQKSGVAGDYYEFRMIGGKSYETKKEEIFDTLQTYLLSIESSCTL